MTDLANASWYDLTLCCEHATPIRLNVYDDNKPIKTISIEAGNKANFSSEKNATADGKDKTPAPIMLLARLNVEVAIVASPAVDDGAAACIQTSKGN